MSNCFTCGSGVPSGPHVKTKMITKNLRSLVKRSPFGPGSSGILVSKGDDELISILLTVD